VFTEFTTFSSFAIAFFGLERRKGDEKRDFVLGLFVIGQASLAV
jgi:hypothetical protein